jgi:inhibitor of KinA sporulation pathway (predicted exonuclease)
MEATIEEAVVETDLKLVDKPPLRPKCRTLTIQAHVEQGNVVQEVELIDKIEINQRKMRRKSPRTRTHGFTSITTWRNLNTKK